jgi:hypothetical protein
VFDPRAVIHVLNAAVLAAMSVRTLVLRGLALPHNSKAHRDAREASHFDRTSQPHAGGRGR